MGMNLVKRTLRVGIISPNQQSHVRAIKVNDTSKIRMETFVIEKQSAKGNYRYRCRNMIRSNIESNDSCNVYRYAEPKIKSLITKPIEK